MGSIKKLVLWTKLRYSRQQKLKSNSLVKRALLDNFMIAKHFFNSIACVTQPFLKKHQKHGRLIPSMYEDLETVTKKILKIFIESSVISLTVCSYLVTYAFQSKSTLYSCLNVRNSMLETGAISEV